MEPPACSSTMICRGKEGAYGANGSFVLLLLFSNWVSFPLFDVVVSSQKDREHGGREKPVTDTAGKEFS